MLKLGLRSFHFHLRQTTNLTERKQWWWQWVGARGAVDFYDPSPRFIAGLGAIRLLAFKFANSLNFSIKHFLSNFGNR